jgi:membrane-associated protease RseP (regulator of RpoE activity)
MTEHPHDDVFRDEDYPATALTAEVVDELESPAPEEPLPAANANLPRRRRVGLPLILFVLTCFSTFFVGANRWFPFYAHENDPEGLIWRQFLLTNWQEGLVYMACVLGILIAHEMGHFLATVFYRIPASFPYLIPMPFSPFGTMGAVIALDGRQADRKQLFDIGIAGPLAGLVVAIPILIVGVMKLDLTTDPLGPIQFTNPLLIQGLLHWTQPPGYTPGMTISLGQLNAYFWAGWVGLFVTGLNMMPVSQLDGGHTSYTIFGPRWARWIARLFMAAAIGYISYSLFFHNHMPVWWLMVLLVMLLGIHHPPTRNDRMPIGWGRFVLGLVTLTLPLLCFAP